MFGVLFFSLYMQNVLGCSGCARGRRSCRWMALIVVRTHASRGATDEAAEPLAA